MVEVKEGEREEGKTGRERDEDIDSTGEDRRRGSSPVLARRGNKWWARLAAVGRFRNGR